MAEWLSHLTWNDKVAGSNLGKDALFNVKRMSLFSFIFSYTPPRLLRINVGIRKLSQRRRKTKTDGLKARGKKTAFVNSVVSRDKRKK